MAKGDGESRCELGQLFMVRSLCGLRVLGFAALSTRV